MVEGVMAIVRVQEDVSEERPCYVSTGLLGVVRLLGRSLRVASSVVITVFGAS